MARHGMDRRTHPACAFSCLGADMTLDDLNEAQRAALVKRINRACNPGLRLRTCREGTRAFSDFGRYYWHDRNRNVVFEMWVDPVEEAKALGVRVA